MAHRNNAVEKEVEDMDEETFVDNIDAMAGVQEESTGFHTGNDAGEDRTGSNGITTSGNKDEEEKFEAMAENGENGTCDGAELRNSGNHGKIDSCK